MARLFHGAAILAATLLLALYPSPAPAAKGVKKNREHHIHGKVVSVQHGKKGGHGTLTIQVVRHKHKKGQNVAAVTKGTQTFTINHHTHVHGTKHMKHHGLAALRPGESVTVLAHHHHADQVFIHHHRNTKMVARR